MREITEEVVNATYPKPLGRGLLKWRIDDLDAERAETKHIVELDNGSIAYVRKIENSALVTDLDLLYGLEGITLVGLPECLGVEHVFMYTSNPNDAMPITLGLELRTQRMRKEGGNPIECPPGFDVDVVLTEKEMTALLEIADISPGMRVAIGDIGRGDSFLCRLTSTLGDGIMIVDRMEDGGIAMNSYNVQGSQDAIRLMDGFDYLVSQSTYGYYNYVQNNTTEELLAEYMANKGYKTVSSVYAISATPKGE
ncbi:hypothetical protein BIZ83_gp167 [Erwinia phage vB_EamM_ChrisDB]|uniref:hypothetical protein n=1 Tax=Erwinia phage vB_EamM_ChrisDB TaxID=1883371 RepID=UPI00081CDA2F|nr:hypothetical protein BIZ83_gp167 [Erwinia phage vB_EamM_ChrisDB]ANZ48686.1 hypothetical protein CHRISDB_124 [Erwinia phage vB_EamM_ChrisDB]